MTEPRATYDEFDWNQPSANMTTEEIEQAAAHEWPSSWQPGIPLAAFGPALLTTALAQLLEIDRAELVTAISAVQCRAMQARVDEELARMVGR